MRTDLLQPIHHAFYKFPFGYLKIGYTDRAVVSISRVTEIGGENLPSLRADEAFFEIQEYLSGQRETFSFPTEPHGTPFQESVWRELLQIPYGGTRSYGEIAKAIGIPGASRAVGNAVGANPLLLAIPCHRVICSDGTVGGFSAGLDLKRFLLSLEGAGKRS